MFALFSYALGRVLCGKKSDKFWVCQKRTKLKSTEKYGVVNNLYPGRTLLLVSSSYHKL